MEKNNQKTKIIDFKPVIAVVGHVDHGKTTLLDSIRKTDITTREKGGITQSIGASEVEIEHDGKKRTLTLIDTPGHEAFANMRTQGVSAADIVLLVIAADDGIKPQTKESIDKILDAKIPFIVVITKTDTPGANVEKVKKELAAESILLEGFGGDVPYVPVVAPTGEKIPELLELIFLLYDLKNIDKKADVPFLGVIIDSKLDKSRGITASVVVKEGTLKIQDAIFTTQKEVGKVRAILTPALKNTTEARPGDAVEILGVTEVLQSGSALFTAQRSTEATPETQKVLSTKDFLAKLTQKTATKLQIILKTKTSAESEAVTNALPSEINIISTGQGEISTSDIMMAKDLGAIVIGFNVAVDKSAQQIAQSEEVFYKSYGIIYELLDEVKDVADTISEEGIRREVGEAKIIAKFGEGNSTILGLEVTRGRLALNDKIELKRGDKVIGTTKISSLKRGKSDVKEVAKELECGAKLENSLDFEIGDAIIAYK